MAIMDKKIEDVKNWAETIMLPKTEFAMRANLPDAEPEVLKYWQEIDLYNENVRLSLGKKNFTLHDGPPYANGNLHIGHALNKILKDLIVRSKFMMNFNVSYIPGWDCHGLPIEWKVEEKYRNKGLDKDTIPINKFRNECRDFAEHWIDIQKEEFKRLGVIGDWDNSYTTMKYKSEALIAKELLKIAMKGSLYQGSKPVMWSVIEKTALAEAEVEYLDYTSDAIWVKFDIDSQKSEIKDSVLKKQIDNASILIWTTTPWTIPGNRAISFSSKINYSIYEVEDVEADIWAKKNDKFIVADTLVGEVMKISKVISYKKISPVGGDVLNGIICKHPFANALKNFDFYVPLLDGNHVMDDTGTGFVHTAPGHGIDDFEIWMKSKKYLEEMSIDSSIPYTVNEDGSFDKKIDGFESISVIDVNGKKGKANDHVISKLIETNSIIARRRFEHQYPHSWRSKKPVIYRNTPQWFISMEDNKKNGLRSIAVKSIENTIFHPETGKNRLKAMIENRPDWVLSRQRSWGVPISLFVNKSTGAFIPNVSFDGSEKLISRICDIFALEGANAWFTEGAKERFLEGIVEDSEDWQKVDDILDVWFESGTTHAFVLEGNPAASWPADLYLEGSDQHRGWFHSSLLESSLTRGRAPYNAVLTHGFTMAKDGKKMSKSLGNVVSPQDIVKKYGADVLRLWVASTDYTDDQRIGEEIIKSVVDSYRKVRNTIRWMLGVLSHYESKWKYSYQDLNELEKYMLHKLTNLQEEVLIAYKDYDFKRVTTLLINFLNQDLSAFYFDIRKDCLYCDTFSSDKRKSTLYVVNIIFNRIIKLYAPILSFTMEDVWKHYSYNDGQSIHFSRFNEIDKNWINHKVNEKWNNILKLRRTVTAALEIQRRNKTIGSSLEAGVKICIQNDTILECLEDVDVAEICITSHAEIVKDKLTDKYFILDDQPDIGVLVCQAKGNKCQRSWRISEDVGKDPEYPDLSLRDVKAVKEYLQINKS
ncbi:MAG: isoleucine--tRNA ligase [Hyphomicrobiales bacterium]|nr:isoleucine--tRNA ligase [Hyphomicrobiales bacterium]|tara:strand:+ start:2161 stop:5124 length:2964 start_codon:yes stop_codon:yes gene_type:complete